MVSQLSAADSCDLNRQVEGDRAELLLQMATFNLINLNDAETKNQRNLLC